MLTILVIDDDVVYRMLVNRALRLGGQPYALTEAGTYAEGLKALSEAHYDCAFLDIRLPDSSGLKLLRDARSSGIRTPIIVLTGSGDEELAVDLMKAGAADYLSKSKATPSSILRSLNTAIKIRRMEDEKQQIESSLEESNERFRVLVEGAKDFAIIMLDTDGRIASWNTGAERILGYGEDEVLRQSYDMFFTGEDRAQGIPAAELETAARTGKALDIRWMVRKGGERFWADGVMVALTDRSGGLRGYEKILQDATDRKRGEEALRYQLNLLETITNNAAEALFLVDSAGVATFVNPTVERMLGWTPGELMGRSLHEIVHHHAPGDGDCFLVQALSGQTAVREHEDQFLDKSGRLVPVSCSVAPIESSDGVSGTVLVLHDISDRKQAEEERAEAVRRERRMLRDVLASVTDSQLILCDSDADLPQAPPSMEGPILLSRQSGLHALRQAASAAAGRCGFEDVRRSDLLTAASEAAMNAVVHAGSGKGFVGVSGRTVQVRIDDRGRGIAIEDLPRAALARGFTTAGTLGHGFKMMLQTIDRIWLLTGPSGTTVVLEQDAEPRQPSWLRDDPV